MAKLDLSGEGLKKLAIQHCEKAVFGICAILLLLLAYWGYKKPVFDDQKTKPETLIASAQRSEQRINNSKWQDDGNEDMSFAKYRVADEKVSEKVESVSSVMLDSQKYPSFPTGEISLSVKPKRTNPEVFPASDVQAKFAYQLIALNPGQAGGSPQINQEIFAPKPEKPKPRRKRDRDRNKGGSGGSGSSSGGSGSMLPPPSGGDDESSPGAGGMMDPGGGGGGGNKTPLGPAKPDYPTHDAPPTMLAELEGVPLNNKIGSDGSSFPSVMWRQVVCVTALVPYKKQVEAYEKALKGTRKYNATEDIPKYLGLVISRRVNGGKWEDVTEEIRSFSKKAETVYYPHLVATQEFDPFLNSPVPGFLMKDFDQFVLHPKSEKRDFLKLEEVEVEEVEESSSSSSGTFEEFGSSSSSEPSSSGEESDDGTMFRRQAPILTSKNAPETKQVRFFDLLANSSIKPGDKIEYQVSVILSNPNLPLSFVMGNSKNRTPGSGGGSGFDPFEGDGPVGGMGGDGGAMRGMGGGPQAPGMGGGKGPGSMSDGMAGAPIQLTAELTLELLGNAAITDADLDGSIRADILKFKEMKPAKITDKGLPQKYGLISATSSVSNAVEFTVPAERFVGGEAAPLTLRRANNVEFYDAEPEGELVYLKRDKSLQMEVPGKTMVYSGSPVVFGAKAEVFNPLDWTIRWVGPPAMDDDGNEDPEKRGNYSFESSAIVLDVMPSETLDNISDLKQEFQTPAEILVFDGVSGFSLRNELDDKLSFRHSTFKSDVVEEETDTPAPGDPFDGDGPKGGFGF